MGLSGGQMVKVIIDRGLDGLEACTGEFTLGCVTQENLNEYIHKVFATGTATEETVISVIATLIAEILKTMCGGDNLAEAAALYTILIKATHKLNKEDTK